MYNNKKKILGLVSLWLSAAAVATPISDFQFKSPAFNGIGYSSHILTIENQENTRRAQVAKDIQAALDKAAASKSNTNIAKFMNNLESRIYAQISQNLATAMFANNNCTSTGGVGCSGSINFEGNTIYWVKDSSSINMTVTDSVGNQTTITVPLGSFQFGN
jgi:uncharacterized membrane protein